MSNVTFGATVVHLSRKNRRITRDLNCATHDRDWLRQDNEQLRRKLIHANQDIRLLRKHPAAEERPAPANRKSSRSGVTRTEAYTDSVDVAVVSAAALSDTGCSVGSVSSSPSNDSGCSSSSVSGFSSSCSGGSDF